MATFFNTEDGRLINLDNVTHFSNGCVSYVNSAPGEFEHRISKEDMKKLAKQIALDVRDAGKLADASGAVLKNLAAISDDIGSIANNLASIADVLEGKL